MKKKEDIKRQNKVFWENSIKFGFCCLEIYKSIQKIYKINNLNNQQKVFKNIISN